jgi:hypothetical protein
MKKSTAKAKWTAAEIKAHTKKILDVVAVQKKENKLVNFTGITKEEIEKKFTRVNSPMIVSQSWGATIPGGTVTYNLGIYNPDPTTAIWLFAHVWVGSGNTDPVTGTFLSNVDARFPRLTQPAPTGLTLAPGASATLTFAVKVPASVEKTNYIGNSCLMRLNWHDTGTYLDRGVFVFAVT